MTISDLGEITESSLPMIVFSDQTSGFMEFLIKFRTGGNYNHVMLCVEPGQFVSQGNTYSKVPFERYMKKNSRLKFVSILGITPAGRQAIVDCVNDKLALPWYLKLYDWVGILGQITGLNFINNPKLEYCSEDAPNILKKAVKRCPQGFPAPLDGIIKNIPAHTSPQKFNEYLHDFHGTCFPVYMKWEGDDANDI